MRSTHDPSADRRQSGLEWRLVLLLSALFLLVGPAAAQSPAFGLPAAAPRDSLAPADSLGVRAFLPDSLRSPADSASLALDSLSAPADSAGLWTRLWRPSRAWPVPARYASPEPHPLPRLARTADRPAEDLADELLPLVPGPLFDQAEVGHRQELALDGLSARHSSLRLDGLELGSRITGVTDLNLLVPGLTDPTTRDLWERLDGPPGGTLDFQTLRASDDSVLTRVRWSDGFLGYVHAEGEFARPLFGGRVLAASSQTFTHQRAPGSHYRGNLFLWNWDKPWGRTWRLSLDQRILRDASEILDQDGHNRHLQQSLRRARLVRKLGELNSLGLDIWQRDDKRSTDLDRPRQDREHLLGAALSGNRLWAGGGWHWRASAERQRLSVDEWNQRNLALDGSVRAGWTRQSAVGRWAVEPALRLGQSSEDKRRNWSLGARLGWTQQLHWADLLLQSGATPPTPEQLHVSRTPAGSDAFRSPWLRAAGLPLLPDSTLAGTRWRRQELRLGTTLWQGRLPVSLRLWRVELSGDLLETPASDSTWSWAGHDHLQWGVQLFSEAALAPHWSIRVNQGWFLDNRELVSREFPSYLVDGRLCHERRFFGNELLVTLNAGLHHEYGGVDRNGNSLWQHPELWLQGEATRRRFTLWWALRNPFFTADNARVESRALHGHEEWLGVRWSFED